MRNSQILKYVNQTRAGAAARVAAGASGKRAKTVNACVARCTEPYHGTAEDILAMSAHT